MIDPILDQILDKVRTAQAGSFGVLSTGEKLAVALVLNHPDWLQSMGYTLSEAISRLGPEWIERVPRAERILRNEADAEPARSEKAGCGESGSPRSITELDFTAARGRGPIKFDYCIAEDGAGGEPVVHLLALRDESSDDDHFCECRIKVNLEQVRQITRSFGEAEVVARGIIGAPR